jgi:hypothetical protein
VKKRNKTAEQAALICDIAASGGVGGDGYDGYRWSVAYVRIADGLSASEASLHLALNAYDCVSGVCGEWTRAVDAEAAQLIREGWRP